jgi:hypothetical protein
MSAALDLFLEAGPSGMARGEEPYSKLIRAAELWREMNQHFSAGVAMLDACRAAWGRPDRMLEALQAAQMDFRRVVGEQPPSSPSSIAALYKLRQCVSYTSWFDDDRATIIVRSKELGSELGHQLFKHYRDPQHAENYLVKGVELVTDRDGVWDVRFPDYEVPSDVEYPGRELILNIPSAFYLFVRNAEWQAALEIVKLCGNAFTSPGLRGWRAVTLAHAHPRKAVERFDEAAQAFETDAMPSDEQEMARRVSHWSSANQQLWAKYFRARARLIESISTPAKVRELLDRAVGALEGTEAGWHSGDVSRFRVLVKVLSKLVCDPFSLDAEGACREYQLEIRMSGEVEQDRLALTFISEAAEGFRGFASDPAGEVTRNRLGVALDALARIPTIGPEVSDAVRPELGKRAMDTILGPVRTWMHRSLAAIRDESQFRMVLLRLLQSGLPLYAQVRHGPLEYGKDIVALLEIDGTTVLRQYQAKCGDITVPKWREGRDEMEEMFQVPLKSFQLPVEPQKIEGFLITNGHANAYVEPMISGWLQEQRQTHKRHVEFVHLDMLVDWINENRLVNELRSALREQGIDIGEA